VEGREIREMRGKLSKGDESGMRKTIDERERERMGDGRQLFTNHSA